MRESFLHSEWHAPFSGGGVPGYTKCIGGAVVGDDGVVLVEGDRVSSGDDVVYAYECDAETVRDD